MKQESITRTAKINEELSRVHHHKTPTPFWFGGVSSMAAACFTHPLDLIKVHLQTNKGRSRKSAISTVRSIVRNYGVFGLYNGLSAALLRNGTYTMTRFGVYDLCKAKLDPINGDLSLFQATLSGIIAGVAGGIAGNPADIINVRMQHDISLPPSQQRNYRNAFHGLYTMLKEEGPKSLTHGLAPNLVRAILATVSQLGTYDVLKKILMRSLYCKDNFKTHLVASLGTGLIATTVCSPADVLKSRAMSYKHKSGKAAPSIFKTCVAMIRSEGWRSLFKGWTPAYVRLCPQLSITFVIYEQLKIWNARNNSKA
ncbi:Mitochondrial dicarboxylate transporter [Mycoemilia scoparia]|uniref:Mitochondrial dicarboxylate transporter n=1 Tax=Mycoemilia scoparia TaxID=417184 RepID=A0A9W8A3R3_9FUNG|nr:Mitochondrial dicarboxylate transporter [Mycoemilia scoparia]